jgi:hypothetical protein
MHHESDYPMMSLESLSSFRSMLLMLTLSYPLLCHAQSFKTAATVATQATVSKDTVQENEYRPAREIKRFTAPTMRLRGTAEGIGLDSRKIASALETKFLQDFAFLQRDFVFDKTYETWEIGLFECEAWTVGTRYPIAFHVQCAGGSMDAPRHWQYATLGYGPKAKIEETVGDTLDAIVAEYAAFVRKAHGKMES